MLNTAMSIWVKLKMQLDAICNICNTIPTFLSGNRLEKATADETKVFYHRMNTDDYRNMAECKDCDAKKQAAEDT